MKLTCPYRITQTGPWVHKVEMDHWKVLPRGEAYERRLEFWFLNGPFGRLFRSVGHWLIPRLKPNQKYMLQTLDMVARTWLLPWQPKECSFCGSAHPDDVLRLIEDGWTVHPTDRLDKSRLEPPPSAGWYPMPPVIARGPHFSKNQLDRIGLTLKARKNDPAAMMRLEALKQGINTNDNP